MRRILGLFLAASAVLATTSAAQAGGVAPRMPLGRATAAPVGYVEFCAARPGECRELEGRAPTGASPLSAFWRDTFRYEATAALGPDQRPAAGELAASGGKSGEGRLALTAANLKTLDEVNRRVNGAIAPANDWIDGRKADVWSLPLAEGRATGDCEDYVLEKRRALLARGLPAEALAIAVVRTRQGESHAVLLVDTDAGELVLDNRSDGVAPWTRADYRWLKRQSPSDLSAWVRIGAH